MSELKEQIKEVTQEQIKEWEKGFQEFNDSDMYYLASDGEMEYNSKISYTSGNVFHWGQLKLLLSEIEALVAYWDPKKVPDLQVVYIGAAYGNHIPILSKMFPTIIWHLYDSSPFRIEETNNIKIYNGLFTNELAEEWAKKDTHIFFISDIRGNIDVDERYMTNEEKKENLIINEAILDENMRLQENWVKIINPYKALLKFRFPYHLNQSDIYQYLYGAILYQSYVGSFSGETRLVPLRNEEKKYYSHDYSKKEYENKLFYHNAIKRKSARYLDPITGRKDLKDNGELINNYDSIHLIKVLDKYLTFMDDSSTGDHRYVNIIALAKVIFRDLSLPRVRGGFIENKTPMSILERRQKEVKKIESRIENKDYVYFPFDITIPVNKNFKYYSEEPKKKLTRRTPANKLTKRNNLMASGTSKKRRIIRRNTSKSSNDKSKPLRRKVVSKRVHNNENMN